MNFPRYEWNENIKPDILDFLKVANSNKQNNFCSPTEYNGLKILYPLDHELKMDLENYMQQVRDECIDITESDDDMGFEKHLNVDNDSNISKTVHDVASLKAPILETPTKKYSDELVEALKDTISVEKCVPKTILTNLGILESTALERVFCHLASEIDLPDIHVLWDAIASSNINNDDLIRCFIQHLFLPKMKEEFAINNKDILLELCQKHGEIVLNELTNHFIQSGKEACEASNILLQHISLLDANYKALVLREFLNKAEALHPNYIAIIEALLNSQVSADILKKLIEMMSSFAAEFSNDNLYGKVLFKAMNYSDKKIIGLEPSLKRILGIHRSIWKNKIEKIVLGWFNDTLTQSFM